MDKKNIIIISLSVLLLASLAVNIVIYNNNQIIKKQNNNIEQNKNTKTDDSKNTNQIANPASVNCKDLGGTLQIAKNGTGGEYGLCYFDDARACEEWAMLRGNCPVGGRKTTGYDTEAQKYCAWLGGSTIAEENAICTFPDGSTCKDDDLFNGKCAMGENIKK